MDSVFQPEADEDLRDHKVVFLNECEGCGDLKECVSPVSYGIEAETGYHDFKLLCWDCEIRDREIRDRKL